MYRGHLNDLTLQRVRGVLITPSGSLICSLFTVSVLSSIRLKRTSTTTIRGHHGGPSLSQPLVSQFRRSGDDAPNTRRSQAVSVFRITAWYSIPRHPRHFVE